MVEPVMSKSLIEELNITAVEVKVEVDTDEYGSHEIGQLHDESGSTEEKNGIEILSDFQEIYGNSNMINNKPFLGMNILSIFKTYMKVPASKRNGFVKDSLENESHEAKKAKIIQTKKTLEIDVNNIVKAEENLDLELEESFSHGKDTQSDTEDEDIESIETDEVTELKGKEVHVKDGQKVKRRKREDKKMKTKKNNQFVTCPICNKTMAAHGNLSRHQQTATCKAKQIENLLKVQDADLPKNKTEPEKTEKSLDLVKMKEDDTADEERDNLKSDEVIELDSEKDSVKDSKAVIDRKLESLKNEYMNCVTCPVCNKTMASHGNLSRHQQSAACLAKRTESFLEIEIKAKKVKNEEEKYVTCPICDKTLVSHGNGNLSRHQQTAACMAKRYECLTKMVDGTNLQASVESPKNQNSLNDCSSIEKQELKEFEKFSVDKKDIEKDITDFELGNFDTDENKKSKRGKDYGIFEKIVTKKEKVTNENRKFVTCPICNKTMASHGNLSRHQQTAACLAKRNETFLKMVDGEKNLSGQKIRPSKLIQPSQKEFFDCSLCGKQLVSVASLKRHTRTVHAFERPTIVRNVKCAHDGCPKLFDQPCSMRKHYNSVHLNIRNYLCDFCSDMFKSIYALKVHLLTIHNHTIDGDPVLYECRICCRNFTSKVKLMSHSTVHIDEKPFKCEYDGCDKWFRIKASRNKHMQLYHQNLKKFVCEVCNKSFARRQYLDSHMYKHTGVKLFRCDICLKMFSQKGNLDVHMMCHTNRQKPYPCKLCGRSYLTRESLHRHRRSSHGIHEPAPEYTDNIETEVGEENDMEQGRNIEMKSEQSDDILSDEVDLRGSNSENDLDEDNQVESYLEDIIESDEDSQIESHEDDKPN